MSETITFDVEFKNFSSKMLREIEQAGHGFEDVVAEAMAKGADAGLGKAMPAFAKDLRKAWGSAASEMDRARTLLTKAAKMDAGIVRQSYMEAAENRMKAAKARFEAETRHTRALISREHKAHKAQKDFLDKSWGDRIDSMREGLSKAFSQAKSGNIKGLMGDVVGGLASAGKLGGAGSAAAGAAGGAAGLGATVAAVAIPLAIVAAGFAAVVKLLIDAVAKGKEMNKTFLDGAAAGDMMWKVNQDGASQLSESLSELRRSATDFTHLSKWRSTSEEMSSILTTANAAGFTFKEMADTTERLKNGMKGYQAVTELSLRYSQLLGVEATTIAEQIGAWEHDLGMGLGQVEEQFAKVTKLAMESGFGVKRFYTMVQQATSGMALYNTRIEEAAILLKKTSDVLGETEAAEFISTLQKGFAGDDYTTKLKRVLLTGQKDMHGMVTRAADRTASAYVDKFTSGSNVLESALADSGLDMQVDVLGDFTGDLAKLNEKDQRKLIFALEQQGEQGKKAATQMVGLLDLSIAKQTGSTNDMIAAMDNADMGMKLEALLDAQVLGDKRLSEMTELERHIFAQTQGLDTEMVEKLARMEGSLLGQQEHLKTLANGDGKLSKADEALLESLGIWKDGMTEDEKKTALAEAANKEFSAYAGDYGWREEEMTSALSSQEALAQQQIQHTRDMSSLLKNGIEAVLIRIYDLMENFWNDYMGLSAQDLKDKKAASEQLQGEIGLLVSAQETKRDEVKALEKEVLMAKTAGEKSDLEEKVKAAKEELATAEAKTDVARSAQSELSTLGSGVLDIRTLGMGYSGAEGFRSEAFKRTGDRDPSLVGAAGVDVAGAKGRGIEKLHGMLGGGMGLFADAASGTRAGGAMLREDADFTSPAGAAQYTAGAGIGLLGAYFDTAVGYDEANAEYVQVGSESEQMIAEEAAKQTAIEEEARIAAEAAAAKAEGDAADALAEQKRLQKELPSLFEEGAERVAAKELLRKAGMKGNRQEIEAFLSGDKNIRSRTAAGLTQGDIDASGLAKSALRGFKAGRTADDFIFTGGKRGGTITPIDQADQFLGVKPGGAIGQAMGGGGGDIININIDGGDLGKVSTIVRRIVLAEKGKRYKGRA
jgi:hypothetical protein